MRTNEENKNRVSNRIFIKRVPNTNTNTNIQQERVREGGPSQSIGNSVHTPY